MTDTRQALADLLRSNDFGPMSCQDGAISKCMCLDCCIKRARAALAAQPVAGAVATEPSEEIQELRAQVEAWRKQCETLTHQVICCGVAARHPDATLTTRGAYAGKWNSPQAEEVRKLRAERDALLAASPHPEPSAQGEPVAWKIVTVGGRYFFEDKPPQDCYSEEWLARCQLVQPLYASAPSTPPHAVVEAVPLTGLASDMRSPDDKPRFRVGADGAVIDDDDFIFDALIRIEGDFGEGQRRVYAQWIADTLNEADTKLDRGIAPKAAQEKT